MPFTNPIQSLYSFNPLLSLDLSQLTDKDLAPKNDSTFFKSIKVVFYTPFYWIAYSVKSVIITCLKVVNFIISSIKIFNCDTRQNINAKIDHYIQSMNHAIESLSPSWSQPKKSCKTVEEQKTLKRLETVIRTAILISLGINLLIGILSKTNALHGLKRMSWRPFFTSTSSCISYYGSPQTFEDAKNILRCNNPFYSWADNSKGWSETRKTIRSMSKFSHPDKGGDPKIQSILNEAHNILKKAFTTENGQRDLKIYECISQISTPRNENDLENAKKIFNCAHISLDRRCDLQEKAANQMLNQIAWVGNYAKRQLSNAYSCICHWQPLWSLHVDLSKFDFFDYEQFPTLNFDNERFSKAVKEERQKRRNFK